VVFMSSFTSIKGRGNPFLRQKNGPGFIRGQCLLETQIPPLS